MSKLVAMPSPLGTNHEGLHMRPLRQSHMTPIFRGRKSGGSMRGRMLSAVAGVTKAK